MLDKLSASYGIKHPTNLPSARCHKSLSLPRDLFIIYLSTQFRQQLLWSVPVVSLITHGPMMIILCVALSFNMVLRMTPYADMR